MDISELRENAREAGLEIRSFEEAREDWSRVLNACREVPVGYTPHSLHYQAVYCSSAQGFSAASDFIDLSCVIYSGAEPIAVWPLSVQSIGNKWKCQSQESPVRPPWFRTGTSERTEKQVVERCLGYLALLGGKLGVSSWVGYESVRENPPSAWHRKLMEEGAQLSVQHEMFVNLEPSLEAIRHGFRKSYRPLISRAETLWKMDVESSAGSAASVFQEFRVLHQQVAGRVTRGRETWEIQEQALREGAAFLVTLRDPSDGRMVGAGYFMTSRTDALYAVGAYDRDLFHLPLGHGVQMKAIEVMKGLGLKRYFIGVRPYPGDANPPTDKDLGIARFKEGFMSYLGLGFRTEVALKS